MASKLEKIRQAKMNAKAREQVNSPTIDFDDFITNNANEPQDVVELSDNKENESNSATIDSELAKIDKNEGNVSRETLKSDIDNVESVVLELTPKNNIEKTLITPKNDELPEIINKKWELYTLLTWGTSIKSSCVLTYGYHVTINNLNRYDLINNIIEAEKIWIDSHPEFPSTEFILSNLSKTVDKNKSVTKTTFLLSASSKEFLKKYSKLCGMKMYEYVEFLIEKYLGDITK